MTIAAHWKVFDRTGQNIDFIERELHKITSVGVLRSEIGYASKARNLLSAKNPPRPTIPNDLKAIIEKITAYENGVDSND